MLRSPKFDCNIPSSLRPVCFPVRSRTHDQFGLTVAHTGARGINHPASSLADVLEVLLRAGFVASAPGTPELCFSKYTLQCASFARNQPHWNLQKAWRSTLRRTVVSSKDRQVRFEFPVRPVATRDELDQAFPSAASRDFLGAWLVPKCVEFRGGAIWKVEIAALRGWARSHARCAPAAPASLTGHNTEPSPRTHNTSRATPRLENLG